MCSNFLNLAGKMIDPCTRSERASLMFICTLTSCLFFLMQFATASAYPLFRLGSSAFVSGKLANFRKRPEQPIILYEFQGCPFCSKVS